MKNNHKFWLKTIVVSGVFLTFAFIAEGNFSFVLAQESRESAENENEAADLVENAADQENENETNYSEESKEAIFVIDETASKEKLLEQFNKVQDFFPENISFYEEEEFYAFITKQNETIFKLCQLLLEKELSAEEKSTVLYAYISVLSQLAETETSASDNLTALIQKMEDKIEDYDRENYYFAKSEYFKHRTTLLSNETTIESEKMEYPDSEKVLAIVNEMKQFILDNPDSAASIVFPFVYYIEHYRSEDQAIEISSEFMKAFQESGNEELIEVANYMEGPFRFKQLVGNELKMEGITLDGNEIDWESYRGKVVLVDFWATWCGPCRNEIPNMLRQYNKYHEQGFDIVGYSIDDEVEELRNFVQEEGTPWSIVSESLSVEKEFSPISDYYGINSIPQMILVDRDGKVIETDIRGNRLNKLLRKLFRVEKKEQPQENIDFF